MKTSTIRLPSDLDEKLTQYAKEKELSKNQVIKQALRKMFGEKDVHLEVRGGGEKIMEREQMKSHLPMGRKGQLTDSP